MANKRRHIPLEMDEYITKWALRGKTATQIHGAMERESRFVGKVPKLRTVQLRVAKLRPPDPSGVWSFLDADPDDAALVLPVLAAAISDSHGSIRSFTNNEAAMIARICRACPDLSRSEMPGVAAIGGVAYLARLYLAREANKQSTDDLDAYLAYGPWRGEDAWARWKEASSAGWIREAPIIMDLFGALGEAAKTARAILERLRPDEAQTDSRLRVRPGEDTDGSLLIIEIDSDETDDSKG